MNTNAFQTILTAAATIMGMVSAVLLNLGCSDVAGTITCVASELPTWLAPWAVMITTALTAVKLILGALQGKLFKPTAVVTGTGAVGTVSPTAVVK